MTPLFLLVCYVLFKKSRNFASENFRVEWDFKHTHALLDYIVWLPLWLMEINGGCLECPEVRKLVVCGTWFCVSG